MGNPPIPPHVRLLIAHWVDDDAPRGAVSVFCREYGISRAGFYKIRAAAKTNGVWNVLEHRSSRPVSSPLTTDDATIRTVLEVRARLRNTGWDHGPISVRAKMLTLGIPAPSRATIARIFTRAGVVTPQPRKKPRSAYRRFVYPAPNCCWQIDATEWTLTSGRTCVIFQLIDDHSRYALASLVAPKETSEAALRVVKLAISRHGTPQKFLSDNGSALNPTRRGRIGQLVTYLTSLGVVPITGKPGKPTTQGKNERFHQTLFRYLERQHPAATLDELQLQVDVFDLSYNNDRVHQSLPDGMTPQAAWDATPKAPPPAPLEHMVPDLIRRVPRTVTKLGTITLHRARIYVGTAHAGTIVHAVYDTETVDIYDEHDTLLGTCKRPEPDTFKSALPRPSTTS